jgi:hypothetical protein
VPSPNDPEDAPLADPEVALLIRCAEAARGASAKDAGEAAAGADGRRSGPPRGAAEVLVAWAPLRAAATLAATAVRVDAADRGEPGSGTALAPRPPSLDWSRAAAADARA